MVLEKKAYLQSRSVGNTVIQIIGKSDVNENVTGVVVMIGLFDIKPLGKIRMPLADLSFLSKNLMIKFYMV